MTESFFEKLKLIFYSKKKLYNICFRNATLYDLVYNEILPIPKWYDYKKPDAFIADPFPLFYKNKLYIFVEEYEFKQQKAYISYIEQYQNGEFSQPIKIIENDFHMSYPFVFEDKGDIYCIPETYQANKLFLYKAVQFPIKWEIVKVLLNEPISDPSIIFHNNLWWIFYTLEQQIDEQHSYKALYIKYSENLMSEWHPHPQNPVKYNIKSSRCAGPLFYIDRELFRPAQDCTKDYGNQLVVTKIKKLTTTEFEDEAIKIFIPDSKSTYKDGTHHLSYINDLTIFDGYKYIYKFRSIKEILSVIGSILKLKFFQKENNSIKQ